MYNFTLDDVRNRRNWKLAECDWTQLSDSPLSQEKKEEWRQYRQSLRDMLNDPNLDITNPQWPQKPE